MASRTFNVFLGTVAVLACGGAIVAVRLDNTRVRRQLARLHGEHQQAERVRADNRELQDLVSRAQTDTADGAGAIRADLVRARSEVEELERKAQAAYARLRATAAQDAENLANNRNPAAGLVRLEHFQNQGQATPAAAFQTFVWAAMKGQDATLAGMIAMDSAAREKGMAVVAALPGEMQATYPTPEKLAALFFAAALTGQPSAQILEVSQPDSQHAVLQVRGFTDKVEKIPMQRGAQGWQIVVPAGMTEKLGAWALGAASTPARK